MKKKISNKQFFWFETGKCDQENFKSYYFNDPIDSLILTDPDKLGPFFQSLEKLSKKYYLAGFFSYELGYLFEDIFKYKKKLSFPYALFHVYKKPKIIDHKGSQAGYQYPGTKDLHYKISDLKLNISQRKYMDNVNKIKDYIYKGDIFQANYTVKYKFGFSGSAFGLYLDLKEKQRVAYNVFAGINDHYIISLSPELFFCRDKNMITTRPMKGTMKRGNNIIEDEKNREFLFNDPKNRSENVMIVDLIRNDLGRISKYGSVNVKKLYEIEKYDTLFQMTSTIQSKIKLGTTIYEFVKSTFPCGSITGAPKIRSMEIIRELEKEDRNIYTGAIGFFSPDHKAKFNIGIRTLLINKNKGEMGVGGGIVYDSKPDDEFRECKLKAQFLIKSPLLKFQMIETMLFDKNLKYCREHLDRLQGSADYFDFTFNRKTILKKLKGVSKLSKQSRYKVRLLLDKAGDFTVEYFKLKREPKDYRISVSKCRTSSKDVFFYHKTTNRELYNLELKKARKKGFFDVIFLNEKDEVTEGSITNIYIEKRGKLYTPPVECGLLNGIMRGVMMKKNSDIKERKISIKDLKEADAIYISNSIIGFQKVSGLQV